MPLNGEFFDLDNLTPEYLLSTYLPGLEFTDANGDPFPDTFYQDFIDKAASNLEDLADISIREKTITAEKHDFHINDYLQYMFLKTKKVPVQEVSEVRAVFPTGNTIQVFPSEWVRLDTESGQINMLPTAGTLGQVLVGSGAEYLPLLYGQYTYVPQLWEIDYTCGFDSTEVPRIIVDAICKIAVKDMLLFLSLMASPIGLTSHSTSVDGLSQSRSYQKPAFADTMDRLAQELDGPGGAPELGLISRIRMMYRGILLTSQ